MTTTPLFSSYRTGENRVTASMIAVFERIGLDVLERILDGAALDGAAQGDSGLHLARFENQVAAVPGSVPDAAISGSFKLLFEVKTTLDVPGSTLGDQVQKHLAGLDRSHATERLYVITPDPEPPRVLVDLADARVDWISFTMLDKAIGGVLSSDDQPVAEQSAYLLRELRRLVEAEGLLDTKDTVIVAAKRAYPAYRRTAAYVCQPRRPFRKGLNFLGFYADGRIMPEVARILRRADKVAFTRGHVEKLRADGDETLAATVERFLEIEPDREDKYWMVFLLTGHDDRDTVRLAKPIKNTTKTESGKTWGWTLGQRYTTLELLTRGYATTTELDAREAWDDRGPMEAEPPNNKESGEGMFVAVWTEELAWRALHVDPRASRDVKLRALKDPEAPWRDKLANPTAAEMFGALRDAGWPVPPGAAAEDG